MEIIKNVLRLKKKEFVTPHLIRITLEGEGVEEYANCTLGNNNKIFIPPAGVDKVYLPVYSEESESWVNPDPSLTPSVRTYTHRAINVEANELVIDFVNHGDGGPASRWANTAEVGFELGVAMKNTSKELYPQKDWYLLVGDATALPVLSCILESLPSSAKGICIIEVHGEEDKMVIDTNADIEFIWLFNEHPEQGSLIASEVKKVSLDAENKFGYIAAEFKTVKELREYLRKENGWTKEDFYAFSYWKAGVAEDQSAKDRREEREN